MSGSCWRGQNVIVCGLAGFAHTQLHSAHARVITYLVNGEGLACLSSEACARLQ